MSRSPLTADLDELLTQGRVPWEDLRGARVFITGGTGFFGAWLLESLLHAGRALHLDVRATVLTRDAPAFLARHPHLDGAPELTFHRGDVRRFDFPAGRFTHVVHAAAAADAALNREQPGLMRDVIMTGTRRALEFAARAGVKKFLFVSSGAVYGPRAAGQGPATEDSADFDVPLPIPDAYAQGKREAERLCAQAAAEGLETVVARGFAFVGPHLPLDSHFAIGNFIRDALRGGPIRVAGDGSPLRSYLYAADLAAWLWTVLLRGAPGRAYNVGSERALSIADLARLVRDELAPSAEVLVAQAPIPGEPVRAYVPSTERARRELGLEETVSLQEAVRRTADWARRSNSTMPA